MIRALFLTVGLLVVVGASLCLLTDRIVLYPNERGVAMMQKWKADEQQRPPGLIDSFVTTAVHMKAIEPQIEIAPPKWMAWLAAFIGAAITIFTAAKLTIPRPI